MSDYELLSTVLGVLAVLIVPLLVLVVRSAVRWGHIEDRLANLADDMRALVIDKDKTHDMMFQQMREDRQATNRRLSWLEQNLWKRGGS